VTMLSGQPNSGAFKKCYLCLGTCVTHVLGPKTHEEGIQIRISDELWCFARERHSRQQCAGVFQIRCIETFCEPGVEITQSLSTFLRRIFLLKNVQARSDAQLPRFSPLFLCDAEGLREAGLCLNHECRATGRCCIRGLHYPFALETMKFCDRVTFSCTL